jgi:hypothetical protein
MMLYAPDLIKSWVDERAEAFINRGWIVNVQLPSNGDRINKAGFRLERGERLFSVTLWGSGMMEIISYDDQTDDLCSTDVELASATGVIERLGEFYLDVMK